MRLNIRDCIAKSAAYIVCIFITIIVLVPLAWVIIGSMKPPEEIFSVTASLIPTKFTLENYISVINRTSIVHYLINSALVSGATLFLTLSIGTFAAFGFSRWDSQLKNPILVLIIIFQLIPFSVVITPYYYMMNELGLIGTRGALIIIYTAHNIPLAIWIMRGFIDTIPRSLDEAASIDGCSSFGVFWRIILPLSLPGLSAAGFLVFLSSWSEFLVPLIIANSRDVAVVSVGLYSFFGNENVQYHYAFAATVIGTLPVILAYIVSQRYLVSGLASGADK
jgi:multiple sugar transport system permease protein